MGRAIIPYFACVCLLVTLVLHVLSYATPFWHSDAANDDYGLWRTSKCIPSSVGKPGDIACYQRNYKWDVENWLIIVRALESASILFWAIPLLIIPPYMYVSLGLHYSRMMFTMMIFTLIADVACVIGLIIYGRKIQDNDTWDVGWGVVVCGVGFIFGCLSTVILLIAFCARPQFTLDSHLQSGFYVDPYKNRLYVVENDPRKQDPLYASHVNPVLVGD